ncbi:MAG TPA: hypothetical protein VF341_01485 [Anaeromyxobacteraceae bacterium]
MKKLGIAVALAALAACAGMGRGKQASEATVPDADLGRLAQGQMGPVDEARQFLGSARNEQARAKLHLQEVQHESELATADAQSAKADADRAAVQAKVANDSRDPGQLEQARVMRLHAEANKRAAEARADYAKKMSAARQASLGAADQQVALGEARLERGKLLALQQANVPAAGKYDMAKFDARVADAQKNFDQALQKARDQESQAMAAQQTWDDAQRQAESQALPTGPAAAPTGTGSVNQLR